MVTLEHKYRILSPPLHRKKQTLHMHMFIKHMLIYDNAILPLRSHLSIYSGEVSVPVQMFLVTQYSTVWKVP